MGTKIQRSKENRHRKNQAFEKNGYTESSQQTHNKYKDTFGIKDITLSNKQKDFQDVLRDNTLTFVEGPAGVGKSLAAFHYAVQKYMEEPSTQIIVIRTPVEAGSDKIGFLPSDLKDKLEPHFSSTKLLLETLLSPDKVQADMEGRYKRIQFLIPNYAIGATWDNAIICIDEAQQIQPLIMKLLLERIGVNSKVIVMGDPSQVYVGTKDRHGMRDAMSKFFQVDDAGELQALYPDIGYFKFEAKDCMRSDIVKTVIEAYSKNPVK